MEHSQPANRQAATGALVDRARLFLEVCLVVLGVEAVLMLAIPSILPGLPAVQAALLDTLLLALFAGPLVYWRVQTALDRLAGPVPEVGTVPEDMMLPIVAALCGLVFTAGLVHGRRQDQAQDRRAELEAVAMRVEIDVIERFDRVRFGLLGTRGLVQAHATLDRAGFRAFWSDRRIEEEYPGVRGFGLIRQIPRVDSAKMVQEEIRDGGRGFAIRSEGTEPDLMVITRIEPVGRNREAWGYDVGSEHVRRQAMETALRSGAACLTHPIVLLQDGRKRAGFLFVQPTQGPQGPGDSLHGRGQVAYAPIVAEELLQGVDSVAGAKYVVRLWASAARDSFQCVFGNSGRDSVPAVGAGGVRQFTVAGLPFRLELALRAPSDDHLSVEVLIAAGGGILSLLVGVVIWLLGLGRRRAEGIALSMTGELRHAKAEAEDALRYSRSFLETIHAQSIVSVTDSEGRMLEVNDAFCDAFGYARKDLVGKTHRILNSGAHDVEFWKNMWSRIGTGRSWRGAICNRSRKGTLV